MDTDPAAPSGVSDSVCGLPQVVEKTPLVTIIRMLARRRRILITVHRKINRSVFTLKEYTTDKTKRDDTNGPRRLRTGIGNPPSHHPSQQRDTLSNSVCFKSASFKQLNEIKGGPASTEELNVDEKQSLGVDEKVNKLLRLAEKVDSLRSSVQLLT